MISGDDIRGALPFALRETHLPLQEKRSGKVRDWYPLSAGRRLLITTDRLSAFDRILGCVPYKGQVLNRLSAWWFGRTKDIIPNHLLSIPHPNAMEVMEVEGFPVEVVVRGFITGVTKTAIWYRYSIGEREIYGHSLPEGLRKNQALPDPIITPTTKGGPSGHDERLTCAQVVEQGLLDARTWEEIQAAAFALFSYGQKTALENGLILVDTKYEFGRSPDGRVRLMDEVHTPDSSRYWKADTYQKRFKAGEEPENMDKEFIRLLYAELGYRGNGAPPSIEEDNWVEISQRYIACYEMLTRQRFPFTEYPLQPSLIEDLREMGALP